MTNTRRAKGRTVPPPKPATLEDILKPGLILEETQHDPFCPTIRTQDPADCHPDCRPVVVFVRPFDGEAAGKGGKRS